MDLKYFFSLQNDLLYILRPLSSNIIKELNIPNSLIERGNLKSNAKAISNELEKLMKNDLYKDNENLKSAYLSSLILSEPDYDKINQNLVKVQTINSFDELNIVFYFKILNNSQSAEDFLSSLERLNKENLKDGKHSEIIKLFHDWLIIKDIDMQEFLNKLIDYLKLNFDYFINHIILHVSFLIIIRNYISSSNTGSSIEYISDLLDLVSQLKLEFPTLVLNHIMGQYQVGKSHLSEALESFEKSLEISEKHGYKFKFFTKNSMAEILSLKGNIIESIKIFSELYREKPENRFHFFNLIFNYNKIGKFRESLELISSVNLDDFFWSSRDYVIISEVYFNLKMWDEAKYIENLAKSFTDNINIITGVMNYKTIIAKKYFYKGNLEKAKELFEILLKDLLEHKIMDLFFENYKFLIQIYLEIFQRNPKEIYHKLQIFSLLNNIISLVTENNLILQKIQFIFIRIKFLNQLSMLTDVKKEIYELKEFVKSNGTQELIQYVLKGVSEIESTISEDSVNNSQSFFMDIKNSLNQVSEINTGSFIESETNLHGLLLINTSGLNLFSHYFSDFFESSPVLLSGVISAINSIISQLSKGQGFLKGIIHDDLSLVMEPIEGYNVVCIASAETFEMREKTRSFAIESKKITLEHNEELKLGRISTSFEDKMENLVHKTFKI